MKQKFIIVFFALFILLILTTSCEFSESKKESKIPYVIVNPVSNVFEANFDQLTNLFGTNEYYGDTDLPIPETDIVMVKAADDKNSIRFDIYYGVPITKKFDVFYGFALYFKEYFFVYFYFPLDQQVYLNLYNYDGKVLKSVNLDLDKAKISIIPWGLAEENPVNVATIILDKNENWETKPGVVDNLIIRFVSGIYQSGKGIYYNDVTPAINMEFNH